MRYLPKPQAWLNSFSRADYWLANIASAVLFLTMLFVFAGAILRYAFNTPIYGGNEYVEMASVAIVMLGLPYCTTRDDHVRIDLLDSALGKSGRAVTDAMYRIIGVVVLWHLIKAYIVRVSDALEYGDRTNLADIPIWPFHALICFGMTLYAVILILQLAQQAKDLVTHNE